MPQSLAGFFLSLVVSALTTCGVLLLFSVPEPSSPTGGFEISGSSEVAGDSEATADSDAAADEDDWSQWPTAKLIAKLEQTTEDDERLKLVFLLADRPEPAAWIPAVIPLAISNDELLRNTVQRLLSEQGQAVIPHLKPLLTGTDKIGYFAGCEGLRATGDLGHEFLPQIAAKLEHDDPTYRVATLFGFSQMGQYAVPYLDQLIPQLQHPNLNVRLWTCRVFIGMGPEAAPAAPAIQELLREGVVSDRSLATLALAAIGPSEDYDVLALIRPQLSAFTQIEKERALLALADLGPAAKSELPAVQELLADKSKNCVIPAAIAYEKISGDAAPSVSALQKELEDPAVRDQAAAALGKLGPAAASAIPRMIAELDIAEEEAYREALVIALGELGPLAKPAVGRLTEIAASDPDRVIRHLAKKALESIQSSAER